jgi:aldehyde:ferredoxin oxidoreductase
MVRGFFNSYLLIDVRSRRWERVTLDDSDLEETLGGKGLGIRLLRRHMQGRADPLSSGNPIVLAPGPAADGMIPGSSRWVAVTRSPQTGFLSHSYSGGRISTPMSRTGNDAFVITGASDTPVRLEITPRGVEFHDAQDLWGRSTYETERILVDRIKARTGSRAGAMVIGPAAENGVRFGTISNDKWRQAGRTGAGSVMGAKKIKGIAFAGDKRRPHADGKGIRSFWKEMIEFCKGNPAVARYRKEGTPMMVEILNSAGAFPNKYWHSGLMDGWESISADSLLTGLKVRPKACEQCFIACGKLSEVLEGPRKGLVVEGPEYETIYAFGGLCLIKSLEEILFLNDLCDRLGMDTISAGNLVAFAMEASDTGKFPEDVRYGDALAAERLIRGIAAREGAGALLADGIVKAAETLGMEDEAIHVKGMEPAGYDPRVLQGMGLAYGISDRGACHLRGTFYKAELAGMIEKDAVEGKAELFIDFEDRAVLFDSLVLCRFFRDIYTWDRLSRIIAMTTGMELDKEGLTALAARISDQARLFNIEMGLTKADDVLPERFFSEPLTPSGSVLTKEDYETMRADYYRVRGWDEEGRPPRP